jgi:hypothetical protein
MVLPQARRNSGVRRRIRDQNSKQKKVWLTRQSKGSVVKRLMVDLSAESKGWGGTSCAHRNVFCVFLARKVIA